MAETEEQERTCRECGCTDNCACIVDDGYTWTCYWVEPDLCSACERAE